MAKPTNTEVGRLAFREEGTMWNAYWAMPDTMVNAIWLGSIAMKGIVNNTRRKEAFMDLMQDLATEVLEDITGEKVEAWKRRTAPEHERTKK